MHGKAPNHDEIVPIISQALPSRDEGALCNFQAPGRILGK